VDVGNKVHENKRIVLVEVESPRLLSSGGRFRAGLDEQV